LHRDAELHARKTAAAVALGNRDAGECEIVRERFPDCGIETALGRHQTSHCGRRRLLREEAAHRGAKLLLFVAECELHTALPNTNHVRLGAPLVAYNCATVNLPHRTRTRGIVMQGPVR